MTSSVAWRCTLLLPLLLLSATPICAEGDTPVGEALRVVGESARTVTRETGHAVRDVTRETGHAVRDVTRETGHAVRDVTRDADRERESMWTQARRGAVEALGSLRDALRELVADSDS